MSISKSHKNLNQKKENPLTNIDGMDKKRNKKKKRQSTN